MKSLQSNLHLPVFGLLMALAAFIRFGAAPLSAGPDVAQFWAFAEVFRTHGLDFYRYADAQGEIFPFKFWGYVYPPVWLLILGLALLTVPLSSATDTMVDSAWRLAAKTPIILADLAIGWLLYRAVPGSKWVKILLACLWLFNPTAWYNSAVFGQFDAIAAALLLASVIMMGKGHDRWAFALAALAGLTKQNAFIPAAVMIVAVARQMGWRRWAGNIAIMAGIIVVVSIPFLVTGNILEYGRSFFFPGQEAGYQVPIMYAFNGFASLITYLHDYQGWDTARYFQYFVPALGVAFITVLVFTYRRKVDFIRGALIGMLVFVTFFYRINYQYLVIFIPLALLVTSLSTYQSERVLALVLALFPAGWLWMFDVSFWFNYLDPTTPWIRPIFENLGMARVVPDYGYVTFAMILTGLCITYTVMAFVHWREPLNSLQPEATAPRIEACSWQTKEARKGSHDMERNQPGEENRELN